MQCVMCIYIIYYNRDVRLGDTGGPPLRSHPQALGGCNLRALTKDPAYGTGSIKGHPWYQICQGVVLARAATRTVFNSRGRESGGRTQAQVYHWDNTRAPDNPLIRRIDRGERPTWNRDPPLERSQTEII